jgi:hypothetical protein
MPERHGRAGRSAGRRTRRRARDEVHEQGPRREQHVPHWDAAAVSGHAPLRTRGGAPQGIEPPGISAVAPWARGVGPQAREVGPGAREVVPVSRGVVPVSRGVVPGAWGGGSLARGAGPLARDAAPLARDAAPLERDAAPLERDAAPLARDAAPLPRGQAPLVAEVVSRTTPRASGAQRSGPGAGDGARGAPDDVPAHSRTPRRASFESLRHGEEAFLPASINAVRAAMYCSNASTCGR